MRNWVLFLLAAIPACGSTIATTSVTCDGVQGGCPDSFGTDAWATASLAGLYVAVGATTGYNWQTNTSGSASASASISEDFILIVTGGSGNGYAEPDLGAGGGGWGSFGVGWASASLGGCGVGSSGDEPPQVGCPWNSVPFVFGVPLQLTLSESAGVSLWGGYGIPAVTAGANDFGDFQFFDASGQALDGASYSFSPGDLPPATPEPATFALAAFACAALLAAASRRAR